MRKLSREAQEALTEMAAGHFSAIADSFSNAGFTVRLPARGILQISAAARPGLRLCLLLSVGVHGDETAPIEILAQLMARLAVEPHSLRVDLLLVVGNPEAIALQKRYVETDLNRLFDPGRAAAASDEALRADEIMRATDGFFSTATAGRWHLDLHTAIRGSQFPTFAMVPELADEAAHQALIRWLGDAGIAAVVLGARTSGTYGAYTAGHCGAISCTAELGRVAPLGQNDLSRFATTQNALYALLTGGAVVRGRSPQRFTVVQELTRSGESFRLAVNAATENFTPMAQGALIAEDGEQVWRVQAGTEYVLFPNPNVAFGQRAALMVAPI